MGDQAFRDPHLTEALSADYTALQNDLEQARDLAVDYQRQLSDKTNDLAMLKRVLERSTTDLKNLQANILALRQERHRLANQAMHAVAFECRLNIAVTERDQLRLENDALRQALERARKASRSNGTDKSKTSETEPGTVPVPPPVTETRIDIPFDAGTTGEILIYPSAREARSGARREGA